MTNYTPLGNRIAIRPLPKKEVTDGGIIIPAEAQGKEVLADGVVIVCGRGVTEVEPNETVTYSASAGSKIEINGEGCVLVTENDVWGVYGRSKK